MDIAEGKRLSGSAPAKDSRDSLEEDAPVRPVGPVVNIGEVQAHPVVEVDVAAVADLPQAGNAGLHAEAPTIGQVVLAYLRG